MDLEPRASLRCGVTSPLEKSKTNPIHTGILQQNFEAVVALLRDSETERTQLGASLAGAEAAMNLAKEDAAAAITAKEEAEAAAAAAMEMAEGGLKEALERAAAAEADAVDSKLAAAESDAAAREAVEAAMAEVEASQKRVVEALEGARVSAEARQMSQREVRRRMPLAYTTIRKCMPPPISCAGRHRNCATL